MRELVASLPAWEKSLEPGAALPFAEALETGELGSGLRYYYRANDEPRDRVDLVVAVRAGSIDERDDERGLAHVLEHLAFRAKSGEDGSWGVLRELEAHGVKFGSHQNAYTSFEETVYWLHVPSDFFARPEHDNFLGINITAANEEDHANWSGFVQAKIRQLPVLLGRQPFLRLHLLPQVSA